MHYGGVGRGLCWACGCQIAVASYTYRAQCPNLHISYFWNLLLCFAGHYEWDMPVMGREWDVSVDFSCFSPQISIHILALLPFLMLLMSSHTSVIENEHSRAFHLPCKKQFITLPHVSHFRQLGQRNATTHWPVSQKRQASLSCLTHLRRDI